MGGLTELTFYLEYYAEYVSVPSRGNWGFLPDNQETTCWTQERFRPLPRRMGVLQFDWIDENKERGAFPYP